MVADVEPGSVTAGMAAGQAEDVERDGRGVMASFLALGRRRPVVLAAAAAMVLGSAMLAPVWSHLRELWSVDPLRSIGAWFPLVALLGVLRAWRGLGWRLRGSWWGLAPVALAAPLGNFLIVAAPRVFLFGHEFGIANLGAAVFLYAVGTVLLVGGRPLLRASIAPLCLLLLLNPAPHWYNELVDLPLQELSANTARAFAHGIGLHPTGEQLQMMFAPNFGMMIVPGCNGVRGSVTLAYLALIFGYACRLRRRQLAMVTVLGFFAGFGLNLVRLCVLVVYYRIGIALPSIQRHGGGVDYAIGGTVFLLATLACGVGIRLIAPEPERDGVQVEADARRVPEGAVELRGTYLRAASLLLLTVAALVVQAKTLWAPAREPLTLAQAEALLPAKVGAYRLTKSYGEQSSGELTWVMGEYSTGTDAQRMTLGFYLPAAYHRVVTSKQVQGLYPAWSGQLAARTWQGAAAQLGLSFYDDGTRRQENAEAICSVTACVGETAAPRRLALERNAGSAADVARGTSRRTPILLRQEWAENDPRPAEELRAEFAREASGFLAQLDLAPVIPVAGQQP